MNNSRFELDIEAKQLFERIAGMDQKEVNTYYVDEQRQLNDWRRSMVEFAYQLAFVLNNYRLSDALIKNKDDIRPMIENLDVLAMIPAKDDNKKVMIRHRGLTRGHDSSVSELNVNSDYVISVGDCMIDNPTLQYLIQNDIMNEQELTRKLNRAFRFFNLVNIYILEIYLGKWELRDKQLVDASLLFWARYFTRAKSKSGIIYDETTTPDPNLTILAGLNGVKTEKFQNVVLNVHRAMTSERQRKKFSHAHSIFDGIFLIDELKSKLVKPAVEINNNTYVKMWRQCFDKQGRFDRSRFDRYRSVFLTWENTFYVIWIDLKSVEDPQDRNSILNCIVRFMVGSPNLNEYIDYILKDCFFYPLYMHFSDRNCLFVANILLFMDSANLHYDFGRTPGEVLFSKAARNEDLIERLRHKISKEWGDRFVDKMETLKSNMANVLGADNPRKTGLPFSFLINTLREMFIFLTIVWDHGFYKIVREMIEEMADPGFEWYQSKNSSENMASLFIFFQLLILCMVKLGDEKDIDVLEAISSREKEYSKLKGIMDSGLTQHRIQVKKIVSMADDAIASLKKETVPDSSDIPKDEE